MFKKRINHGGTVPSRKRKRRLSNADSDDDSEGSPGMPSLPFPPQLLPGLMAGSKRQKDKIFRDANHIYFRDRVTMDNVNKLVNLIDEANSDYITYADHEVGFILPKPLYVHITSYGGDLQASFIAYDYMKQSTLDVYTVAEGPVVSAGSIMYMAGKVRFMLPTSYVLIHQLRSGVSGTHADIEDEYANCEEMMDRMRKIYLSNIVKGKKRCKLLTDEDLKELMKHDIYWDYNACVEKGLVHSKYTNAIDRNMQDKLHLFKHFKEYEKYIHII